MYENSLTPQIYPYYQNSIKTLSIMQQNEGAKSKMSNRQQMFGVFDFVDIYIQYFVFPYSCKST